MGILNHAVWLVLVAPYGRIAKLTIRMAGYMVVYPLADFLPQ